MIYVDIVWYNGLAFLYILVKIRKKQGIAINIKIRKRRFFKMKKQLLIIYAIILGLVCLILPSPGFSAAGDLVWEFPSGGVVESSPTISGGFVYVGSNEGKVYCLDALTGIEDWYSPTGHYVSSSPAV